MNTRILNQVNRSTPFAGQSEAIAMISSRGLSKTFKTRTSEVHAVRDVNFDVHKGEIVGFLGPNGAGKSVTMKMLSTLLEVSKGAASVVEFDLLSQQNEIRSRIGVVSQRGSTSDTAKAGDEIVWHAQLYGISPKEARRRGKELFKALDLEPQWEQKCESLSGGQRRRIDIAMGLIHRPQLVFMDEPTTGLDPQSRANLWDHIRKLRDKFGTTIFLTTHYMDEADALCDRILIIDKGSVVATGTPKQLKSQISADTIRLTVRTNEDAAKTGHVVDSLGWGKPEINGNLVRFQVDNGAKALPGLMKSLGEKEIDAIGVEVSSPTLDDVFLSLTGRTLRD